MASVITIAKPGVDRAGDEVGREDRRVPAGQHRHREVEAHDRVDREHERRRDAGEQQVRRLVALPVLAPSRASRARASRRSRCAIARLRAVAQRGHVGHEAREPEQRRHRAVGRDREHVPDQRAAELRPQPHRVRIREQPIGRQPRPAGVEQREHRRARHREERHRLGEAVDRRAPLLAEEQQDRRDQRAGVADTDPPDEVDDVERPADRARCCPRCRCPSAAGCRWSCSGPSAARTR